MQLADFASQRMLKNNGLRSRSYLFSSLSLGLFAESRSLSNLFFSRNFSNTKRSFIFLPALLLSLRFSSTSEVFIRLALIFLLILLFFEMRTDRAAEGRFGAKCSFCTQLTHAISFTKTGVFGSGGCSDRLAVVSLLSAPPISTG